MARARSSRLSFAKLPEVQPLPDLLAVQRDSFDSFIERGLRQIFEEISPIEDFTGNLALELTDHRFGDPTETIEEAKDRDSNYSKPLFVTARFLNRETGEISFGRVPAGSVVVPGSLPASDGSHSLYCAVIIKQVDQKTRAKVGLNELLRD